MSNPWKVATLGIGLTVITALTTGLTTAYVMRGGGSEESRAVEASSAPAPASMPAPRRAQARLAPAPAYVPAPAVYAPAPAPVVAPVTSTPVAVGSPTTVGSTTPAAESECATMGDRMWRIAKPGLAGALLGAGVGAAGGAVADGSKGAGKGALIGGLVGTTAGAAYGAYKTKNECGTILGGSGGSGLHSVAAPPPSPRAFPHQSALQASGVGPAGPGAPRSPAPDDQITIYGVR
jgi:hypothetical protein